MPTPAPDHPWRTPFLEDKDVVIARLTSAEIVAIKIMRWREYSWAKIGRILDCHPVAAMRAMNPKYRPLKES